MKRFYNPVKKSIKKRILILCEDAKSSLLYFNSFKKDEEYKRNLPVAVEIFHPKHCSPLGLVNDAIKRRDKAISDKNPYDEIWVVFDKNSHTSIPQAFKRANKKNIKIAISIICFEFWILLHYEYTTKSFNKCFDLITYLNSKHNLNYKKCENCFEILKPKIRFAIYNAKKVIKFFKYDISRRTPIYNLSAYTNVHELVQKLLPDSYLKNNLSN